MSEAPPDFNSAEYSKALYKARLAEFRAVPLDATLLSILIGSLAALEASGKLHSFTQDTSKPLEETNKEYFAQIVYPGLYLDATRQAALQVIGERLAADYTAHPDLHRPDRILRETSEFPNGTRYINSHNHGTLLDLLRSESGLKPAKPTLWQRTCGKFRGGPCKPN